eukprot:TRINITY_DN382_c3_g1_i1.p1 TRINITY_DN382_c3_g1~~TRINITY_DN382_c3_g1_i1.p1  ORF type:complete len:1343 (+),score=272.19 TRINITY_DN382_c3_g1_i1:297-4325(+)
MTSQGVKQLVAQKGKPARLQLGAPQKQKLQTVEWMQLHFLSSGIILEKTNSSLYISDPCGHVTESSLCIDRLKGDPALAGYPEVRHAAGVRVCGILGVIRMLTARYLITIADVNLVGDILGAPVYLVQKTRITPIPRMNNDVTETEKRIEKAYLQKLTEFLDSSGFYFSSAMDLTQSLQRRALLVETNELSRRPLWEQVDNRFFWNRFLLEDLVRRQLSDWLVPVFDGFVKIADSSVSGCPIKYVLISRRGCRRAGVRYQTRGADPVGHVANFVESEQIIIATKPVKRKGSLANTNPELPQVVVTSFCQTRGSIPILWQQRVIGMTLKPVPQIDDYMFSKTAFERHFAEQRRMYGKQVMLSLVDKKGTEQEIGEAYGHHVRLKDDSGLRFVWFDFHEECKGNRYDKVNSHLMGGLKDDLSGFGFYSADKTHSSLTYQCGSFRTNCMDCLDRTNVVQSVIARMVAKDQMIAMGILTRHDTLESHATFENMFKHVWADNADAMSRRYTGTGALKTEFTRTGRRSLKGAVTDGFLSTKRIMNQKFNDGDRMEAIDLFLGRFTLARHTTIKGALDGVHRFVVQKFRPWNTTKSQIVLEVNRFTCQLVQYDVDKNKKKEHSLLNVWQLARVAHSYKALRVLINTSAVCKDYLFSSAEEREQFICVLTKYRNIQKDLIQLEDVFTASGVHDAATTPQPPPVVQQQPLVSVSQPASVKALPPIPVHLQQQPHALLQPQQQQQQQQKDLLSFSPPTNRASPTPSPSVPASPIGNLIPTTPPSQQQPAQSNLLLQFDSPADAAPPPIPKRLPTPLISSPASSPSSSPQQTRPAPPIPASQPSLPPSLLPAPPAASLPLDLFKRVDTPTPQHFSPPAPTPPTPQQISASSPDATAPDGPSGPPPPIPKKPCQDNVDFFVGSWNMTGASLPKDISTWIPAGKDVYAIGVQNCTYAPPKLRDGNPHCTEADWLCRVQRHLGDDYQCVANTSTTDTLLQVIVHKRVLRSITNIAKTVAVVSSQPPPHHRSVKEEIKKTRDHLSANAMSVMWGAAPPSPNANDVVGCAVAMFINDTSLCFVNALQLDGNVRISLEGFTHPHSFEHVFLFGYVNTNAYLRSDRWVELYRNDAHGNLLWRSLFDGNLSRIFSQGPEAFGSMTDSPHSPLAVSFTVTTAVVEYDQLASGCKFVLHEMQAADLTLLHPGGAPSSEVPSPYLVVHAPFLKESGRTIAYRKVQCPSWPDPITLDPFIQTQAYWQQKCLTLEVWHSGDSSGDLRLLGAALIQLRKASPTTALKFKCHLLSGDDQPCGFISGKLLVQLPTVGRRAHAAHAASAPASLFAAGSVVAPTLINHVEL